MENATHIPPEPAPHDASAEESLRRGHEVRDATLRPIIIFVVVMVVSALAIHVAVLKMMKILQHQNLGSDATPSPFAATRPSDHPNPPPEPRLQPSVTHDSQPVEDMGILRKRWRTELSTYAAVEGQPDRARIPIERAMQLAVERGLPRATTTQPATRPAGGGT